VEIKTTAPHIGNLPSGNFLPKQAADQCGGEIFWSPKPSPKPSISKKAYNYPTACSGLFTLLQEAQYTLKTAASGAVLEAFCMKNRTKLSKIFFLFPALIYPLILYNYLILNDYFKLNLPTNFGFVSQKLIFQGLFHLWALHGLSFSPALQPPKVFNRPVHPSFQRCLIANDFL
jgi:hypothetical protein